MITEKLVNLPKMFDSERAAHAGKEVGTEWGYTYFEMLFQFPSGDLFSEATDEELLRLIEKSGTFSFWENPEEDIYTPQDGTPL